MQCTQVAVFPALPKGEGLGLPGSRKTGEVGTGNSCLVPRGPLLGRVWEKQLEKRPTQGQRFLSGIQEKDGARSRSHRVG